jgi:hypothetical protein
VVRANDWHIVVTVVKVVVVVVVVVMVKWSLCLTKYDAMKTDPLLN